MHSMLSWQVILEPFQCIIIVIIIYNLILGSVMI
jgi:hypothetical protein